LPKTTEIQLKEISMLTAYQRAN